ncbi:phage tail protein [Wolbachia endosymbiont of Pentalonia nigronervosa]|uniref:phage tail protein n=1 Tax=Wolbachia endosymbiont of Pentalonia nigronervosa TaxID=1301914 RepID=UPI00165F3C26|nr:phage tail protein [Wolbachia endosymbiont of Pentalonia nigronervosa]MBD0392117.1 phage tail protein [Wolbachia endosymbiont of Pentalonia nigronervosa]
MLLPPNATKQEKALVEAIDYRVDPRSIRGFKFNLKDEILPCLIEEYGLEEILLWVKDKKKAIKEGVEFQRLRGTPASLKIALKWANIDDITIIEEPPGKHFFELQIGIQDVPNDFFVDAVIELAKLSLPARSRLMRIFNDLYNAQRFMLDESIFGDLLSDYSGVKVAKEGPVLSFGRKNAFELKIANPSFKFGTFRAYYERNYSSDLYRLDIAILGETEPHTKNYNGIYERNHLWYNFKALYPIQQHLLPPIKFAKAQVVLSDSWKLGEINACFPVTSVEEEGGGLYLSDNKLSEQTWNLKYKPILERFSITYRYDVKNFTDQKIIESNFTEYHVNCENDKNSEQKDSIHELANHILVFYPGVLTWHEHKHLNRSWSNEQPICYHINDIS